MTTVNIHKSKFIITLLNQMLHAFSILNKSDRSLNQVAAKIKELMDKPEIDGDELAKLLMKAKVIIESYEIKPKSDKPKDDPLADLPLILYSIFEELENIIATQKVMDKISGKTKHATLNKKLEKFCNAIDLKKKLAATNTTPSPKDKGVLTFHPEAIKNISEWIEKAIRQCVKKINDKHKNDLWIAIVFTKQDNSSCNIHIQNIQWKGSVFSFDIKFDTNAKLVEPQIVMPPYATEMLHASPHLKTFIEKLMDELSEAIQLPRLSEEKDLWWKDDKTGKLIRPAYLGENKHQPPKISWSLVDAFTYVEEEKNTPRKIEPPK